jgi:transposase
LQRGKSDKLDAIRIATYALKNQQNATLWRPTENSLEQLQTLITTRNRLLKVRTMLEVPIQEVQPFNPAAATIMQAHSTAAIEQLVLSLKEIERQIQVLIRQHQELSRNYQLSRSVPGVGPVTAYLLLAYNQNFKCFESAKQLACFCSVAPFEHTSGTSIKGRSRVSPMANKRLKTALHMAAMQAMQGKSDLALYYQRKAKEGKNKMFILNAMRNKILHHVFSVVKRGHPITPLNAA